MGGASWSCGIGYTGIVPTGGACDSLPPTQGRELNSRRIGLLVDKELDPLSENQDAFGAGSGSASQTQTQTQAQAQTQAHAPQHAAGSVGGGVKGGNAVSTLTQTLAADMQAVDACLLERMQSDVALIPQLAGYLIAAGGKRIRPLLSLASARLCDVTGSGHVSFAAAVELIHTATLLHDDVVDESDMRRGQATANRVWSNQASVLVGDFLYSQSFQLMVEEERLACLRILAKASAVIAAGEVLQLSIQNDLSAGEAAYMKVIEDKTAELFAAACEVGASVAGANEQAQEALRLFGLNLGIAFQLVDDALDYHADQAKLGKTVGDDFAEGKITLPVLLAYGAGDADQQAFWRRTIEQREQAEGDLAQAQAFIAQHDAIAITLAKAQEFADQAKAQLDGFANRELAGQMCDVVDFAVSRGH